MLGQTPHVAARLQESHPPVLLIVVDTEEEFGWDKPFDRTSTQTASVAAQRHVHDRIYDRLGIVPTYVIDYPVATTPTAVAAMRALMESGRCEIGTQLHPWVSPPHEEVVSPYNSYTGNLPPELEFEKLRILTNAIEENFGMRPTTFKAGRYSLGPQTSATLARLGYRVDVSIVPYTSFAEDSGPDFSAFGEEPFWFGDPAAPLLELPVTTGFCGALRKFGPSMYPILAAPALKRLRAAGFAARLGMLERIRLTPEGGDEHDMCRVATALVRNGCQILTLTYHSPSIVPGNTPYVRSPEQLENFLRSIEIFCEYFKQQLGGVFMSISGVVEELGKCRSTVIPVIRTSGLTDSKTSSSLLR